jgi:hypothetical protein
MLFAGPLYLWVTPKGKVSPSTNGGIFLSAFFADILLTPLKSTTSIEIVPTDTPPMSKLFPDLVGCSAIDAFV